MANDYASNIVSPPSVAGEVLAHARKGAHLDVYVREQADVVPTFSEVRRGLEGSGRRIQTAFGAPTPTSGAAPGEFWIETADATTICITFIDRREEAEIQVRYRVRV